MPEPKNWAISAANALIATGLLLAPVILGPSTAAADGPPAPSTDTRIPSLLGFNDHPLDGRAPAEAGVMLDRVAQLGSGFVRIDIHWPWLEWDRPGRANWNKDQVRLLDNYLTAAHARGIDVEMTVLGTPCWAAAGPKLACSASERESSQTAAPRDPQEFANFVGDLVSFAAGRAHYVGVGNEPNHPMFTASPDPAAYTRVLQLTYARVKAIDPSIAIVAGALAPGNPSGARLDSREYLQAMYAAGARGAFDYLEYHPYTDGQTADWFDPTWPLLSFASSVPAIHAVMTDNGDDHQMILGEAGWATLDNRSCSDCGGVNLGVSPTQQADNLLRALDLASQWQYVHKFVVYELADHGPSDSTSNLDHFGVLGRDLSLKPGATALADQITAWRQPGVALANPVGLATPSQ